MYILNMIKNFITADIIVRADHYINTLLYVFRDAAAVKTFIWITLFGESLVIVLFTLIASLILFLYKQKWNLLGLWFAVVGSEGFTFLIKIIFDRPRPMNAVFLETSASFPSAHATVAVAFYGFIAYLLMRKIKQKKYRVFITLSGLTLIALIGFSRLYLGVHYMSDVLVGYLIGFLWLALGIRITRRSGITI